MHGVAFLQDLAVVMIVAGLVTVLFHMLKQPVVLGYIVAGVIIGPHTPPFPLIHDQETINTLAELGVIFLMFSLGLEFSFRKLKQVGTTAIIGGSLEILLMAWVGYQVGQLFGWGRMNSIFLGAMLSISSTTIIVKALADLRKSKEPFAQLIFGILIVEDILAILMIALLSGIAMSGSLELSEVLGTITRLGIFLTVALVAGLLTVPRTLRYLAGFKSNEVLLISVLGMCFGVSLLAVKLGYSVALGAFIIGAVIAESRELGRIEQLMEPLRDMFSAVFFVTIGLMIQPKLLLGYALPITIITIAVVLGKVLTCSLGAFVAGNDRRTSLRVGMGLAQIGEFSFIIASLGLNLKVTSDFLYPIAVTVSALTTLLTPYLIKRSDWMVHWFDRHAPRSIAASLDIYTRWVGQLRATRSSVRAATFLRRWSWQIALNIVLIAGIFIGLVFLRERYPTLISGLGVPQRGLDATIWASALILSMPLLIATYRKLQAFSMLVGDVASHHIENHAFQGTVKGVVTTSISITGILGLGLFLLLMSAAVLPSWQTMVVLLLIIGVITAVMWRAFIRIYSRAQFSLRETLEAQPEPHQPAPVSPLAGLLDKAQLAAVTVSPQSRAIGRLIRELRLRTETGASIVGLEREGAAIVNPGPDEELMAGDKLLLIGQPEQLESARALLHSDGGAPESIPVHTIP